VKYWGVTGSIPAPLKPEHVRAKAEALLEGLVKAGGTNIIKGPDGSLDPNKLKLFLDSQPLEVVGTHGRNTTCIEIQARDSPLLILDAGSGLRELGLDLMKRKFGPEQRFNPLAVDEQTKFQIHLAFTHVHWDHIQGFPFFVPAFFRETDMFLYARRNHRKSIEDTLRGQQEFPNFPVELDDLPCVISYNDVKRMRPAYIRSGNLVLMPQELTHPDGVFGYRIEMDGRAFIMATDTEHHDVFDPRLINLAKRADILYYDAQYTPEEYPAKIDWGHSTYEWAVKYALEAEVATVVLGHHEPTHDDFALAKIYQRALEFRDAQLRTEKYRGRKLEVVMGYEGLVQELE
jgi:phosphoribosyl 1,2-cyclic phosphodiesterase